MMFCEWDNNSLYAVSAGLNLDYKKLFNAPAILDTLLYVHGYICIIRTIVGL